MKKLLLTLCFLLPTILWAQDNLQVESEFDSPEQSKTILTVTKPETINLNLNSSNILETSNSVRTGPIMLLGGASLILAGALTTPFYVGSSTTEKKPFFQQGDRAAAIISGSVVLVVGMSFTINGY
jgi:hypothetical protein